MSDQALDESARVLVVEDNAELSEMLGRLLRDCGYRADLARDGQAGLHHALTREYDVLMVDRGLPGIDGLDLIIRLRRRLTGPRHTIVSLHTPIISGGRGLPAAGPQAPSR